MISNTYATKILKVMTGVSDSLPRANYVYIGLSTTEPNAATGLVSGEPSAASYSRKIVGGKEHSETYFGSNTGGVITNLQEIQFKTARQAWTDGTTKLKYWFLSESATGVATIWGVIKDVDGTEGIFVEENTVPTFYENELKASIDVPLAD